MTKIFSILLILITFSNLHAQKFDNEKFNENFEIAQWLYDYDAVAWWTSDSVLTGSKDELDRIGTEWFCYQDDKNNWHAAYGKFENNKYDLVFHYIIDAEYNFTLSKEKIDTTLLNSHSRALINANKRLKSKYGKKINIRLNQFIKRNSDNTLSVWLIPAFQITGEAVYGGEFHYIYNEYGNDLLAQNNYKQSAFKAFNIDNKETDITLNYRDKEVPTLGSIYFAWYYKKKFNSISIDCKESISTILFEDGSYSWVHSLKE